MWSCSAVLCGALHGPGWQPGLAAAAASSASPVGRFMVCACPLHALPWPASTPWIVSYLHGHTGLEQAGSPQGTPGLALNPCAEPSACHLPQGHIALDQAVFPEGTPGLALDTLARVPLWNMGLNYRHGTGHGVGAALNVHEGPQSISTRWANKMKGLNGHAGLANAVCPQSISPRRDCKAVSPVWQAHKVHPKLGYHPCCSIRNCQVHLCCQCMLLEQWDAMMSYAIAVAAPGT